MTLSADHATVNAIPAKPPPMPVIAEAVPPCLRQLRRWVVFRWEWNAEKYAGAGGWDKAPRQTSDAYAMSNTPATWTTFDPALAAHQSGRFDGIGITLGKLDDGRTLSGIDLDDVRDPATGDIAPWALYAAYTLDSYTELSPSGTGLKARLSRPSTMSTTAPTAPTPPTPPTPKKTLRLLATQKAFRESNASIRGFIAGVGSGKSHIGCAVGQRPKPSGRARFLQIPSAFGVAAAAAWRAAESRAVVGGLDGWLHANSLCEQGGCGRGPWLGRGLSRCQHGAGWA
jgi:hypothetical protein